MTKTPPTPWPFQQTAIDKARLFVAAGHKKIVLVSPTGSGKRFIACEMARLATARGKSVLFLVDARQLNYQFRRTLEDYGIDYGTIMAGEKLATLRSVQVATIQTLSRRLESGRLELPDADLIILDECHKSMSKTWQDLLAKYLDAIQIGYTATPARADGRGLGDHYTAMVHAAKPSALIRDGYLVRCRVFADAQADLSSDFDFDEVVPRAGGDYAAGKLGDRVRECLPVGNIVAHWQRFGENRPTICWAPDVRQSIGLVEEFEAAGVPSAHIDGETPQEKRDEHFGAHEYGEIKIISSCGVLREGVDLPWASCGILLQPTRHLGTYVQMAGRLLRTYPGKADSILLDHTGAVYDHGFPHWDFPWELVTTDKKVHEVEKEQRPKERKPITCAECGHVYETRPPCPHCGHVGVRKGRRVRTRGGRLVEIDDTGINSKPKPQRSPAQKEWDRALGRCANSGKKMTVKQAKWLYHQATGEWPDGLENMPARDSDEWSRPVRELYPNYRRG